MPTIIVNIPIIKEELKEKVSRDLFWYDVKMKKMMQFKGGRLEYEYKYDEKLKMNRMLPKVIDVEVSHYKEVKSNEAIEKWIKTYTNYNDVDIILESKNEDNYTFTVQKKDLDDFVYGLERNNFNFDLI